jgi:uncharacterized protein (DUF885 family)
MSRRVKRFLKWSFLTVVGALAVFLVPTIWFKPWSIDHFYLRTFIRFAAAHPSLMTGLGMLDGTPLDFYSDKLDDASPAGERKDLALAEGELKMLHSYKRDGMTAMAGMSYDVMDWFLTDMVEGQKQFARHDYPINQMSGFQSDLPDFVINLHPMRKPNDLETYVKRLSKFGIAVDQTIQGLELRRQAGVVPPSWSLEKSLVQMREFRAHAPKDNPLYATLLPKLDKMKGLKPADREKGLADVERQIEQTVQPAWDRLIAATEKQLAVATDDDGVWKFPDGAAYYDYCLKHHTTTNLPADTIHAIGLEEVARIQTQMRDILRREGYPTDDLANSVQRAQKEPRFRYANDDSGRAQILADYRAILDESKKRMPQLFNVMPKSPLAVERVPPFREKGAPGAYYQRGSMDGKRPGTFYANLFDPNETTRPGMRTLPARHSAGAEGCAVLPHHGAVHRLRGRLGSVCRAAGARERLPADCVRLARRLPGRAVPRGAPGGRHRDPPRAVDACAGDLLHDREHRNGHVRGGAGDRALHRESRPGVRLQGRPARDPAAPPARDGRAG